MLGQIVSEAIHKKLLDGSQKCDILLVGADKEAPKWQAVRLIAPNVKTTKFRKHVREFIEAKNLHSQGVRSTLPKQGSTLYRKKASIPPLYQQILLIDLHANIME